MTGIYGIHNTITNEWYVGQAQDIKKRNSDEILGLRKNGHIHYGRSNKHLDRAWGKYGEASFEWVILEECSIEKLDEKEIFWIKEKDSYKHGYNMTIGGGGRRGTVASEETRKKMSAARIGKKRSPEACKHIREAKLGEKNPMFGKNMSEETKKKKSISNKLSCKNKKAVICIETGICYESACEAARLLGVQNSKISSVCNHKRKTTGGYTFRFVEDKL